MDTENEFQPLDLKAIAREAAKSFGLSIIDDRQFWPSPASVTADILKNACFTAASENAASAVSQALGKQVEALTSSIDVEYSESGAMGDFDAVVARYATDLVLDFSTFGAAKTWDEKVLVVREALNAVLTVAEIDTWVLPLSVAQLLEYANTDERLKEAEGLKKAIAALSYPGSTQGDEMPEFIKRKNAEAAKPKIDKGAEEAQWEEAAPEPAGDTAWVDEASDITEETWEEPVAPATKTPSAKAPAATGVERLGCAMIDAAGISNDVMAEVMGISKPYYSMIKSGKRPWPGIKDAQAVLLAKEIDARAEAIAALREALDLGEIRKAQVS